MDRPLTKPQVALLTKAMRSEGAVAVGGSQYRTADALASQGLGDRSGDTFSLNKFGMLALRDYRARRWASYGCMAYLRDLQEVEEVLAATFPESMKKAA